MRANSLHGELCHSARNSTTFTKTNHSYLACNILSFYSDAEVIFHHHSGKGCWGHQNNSFVPATCLSGDTRPKDIHPPRPILTQLGLCLAVVMLLIASLSLRCHLESTTIFCTYLIAFTLCIDRSYYSTSSLLGVHYGSVIPALTYFSRNLESALLLYRPWIMQIR